MVRSIIPIRCVRFTHASAEPAIGGQETAVRVLSVEAPRPRARPPNKSTIRERRTVSVAVRFGRSERCAR